jgi:hypothetical protein
MRGMALCAAPSGIIRRLMLATRRCEWYARGVGGAAAREIKVRARGWWGGRARNQ